MIVTKWWFICLYHRCPEGTVMDDAGNCIDPNDCQCYHNGNFYNSGFIISDDGCHFWLVNKYLLIDYIILCIKMLHMYYTVIDE